MNAHKSFFPFWPPEKSGNEGIEITERERGEEKTLKTHKSHTDFSFLIRATKKISFLAHEKIKMKTRICYFENLVQG